MCGVDNAYNSSRGPDHFRPHYRAASNYYKDVFLHATITALKRYHPSHKKAYLSLLTKAGAEEWRDLIPIDDSPRKKFHRSIYPRPVRKRHKSQYLFRTSSNGYRYILRYNGQQTMNLENTLATSRKICHCNS